MIALIGIALVGCILLLLQQNHYEFHKEQKKQANVELIDNQLRVKLAEFEKKLKETEDYKKRVDALTVKAGFGL